VGNRRGHRPFGSVRKERSGRYSARVPIPDSGGKHRSLGTFDRKRDAEDALAVERASIVGGTWVDPARGEVTLADYGARFIATNNYRPRSKALNQRLLDTWIAAQHYATLGTRRHPVDLGSRPLRSIAPEDVRTWLTAIREESRTRAVKRVEKAATSQTVVNVAIREWASEHELDVAATGPIPRAVRDAWVAAGGFEHLTVEVPPTAGATEPAQAYRLLHAILQRAQEEGLIPANPARIKGAGEVDALERQPATVSEVRAIAEWMPPRYRAAVWLAALTSLRSGELFALERRDYDVETRALRVERSVELEAAAEDFGEVKATASLRTVVVPRSAADALERHMAAYVARGRTALIFTTSTGAIIYPDRIGKPYRRARAKAGRPDLHWHDLRHTGQSLAAASGAGIKELQARAGHSTTSAAVRYLHKYGDADRRVADGIDALVNESTPDEPEQ
jgi:integrase